MSFKKIIKGYANLFSGLLSFLAIALACIVVGFAVSYPLWLIATSNAAAYTTISISLFALFIVSFLISKILKGYKKDPRGLFISASKKITVIGGLILFVFLILNFYKILALIELLVMLTIYGILAFGISQARIKVE